jgi:hypothetical protein
MRPIALIMAAAGALLLACYNPKIQDGGLKCSARSECPSGFTCSPSDGRCHTAGSAVTIDGAGGVGGAPGTDGVEGMCTTPVDPYGPFDRCPADTAGGCDQVCQAGCKCGEVCRPAKGGAFCRVESAPFPAQYERCDMANDTCRPGLICIEELPGRTDCGAHCYRLCKTDAQCPTGATCSEMIQVMGQNIGNACSIPVEDCNPYGQARCAMPLLRPAPSFGCYLVPSNPDLAACQCAGTIKTGDTCKFKFDCEPGAECIAGASGAVCRKVCLIGALTGGGACPATQPICEKIPKSTKYGYCRM